MDYELDSALPSDESFEPDAEPTCSIKELSKITSMEDYLFNFGKILGRKAIEALEPLHIPMVGELPDFSHMPKEPFEAQKHVVAAAIKMMDNVGSGFIVGEMGTGKTLLGSVSIDRHAARSRRKGGSGGNYRALVLCPDHLISKWVREIEKWVPGAKVGRFGPQSQEEDESKLKTSKQKVKHESGSKQTLRDILAVTDKGGFIGSKRKKGEAGNSKAAQSVSTGDGVFSEDGKTFEDGASEDRVPTANPMSGTTESRVNRWSKPVGAEWYVMGRNQAKWLSDWAGIADEQPGFQGGTKRAPLNRSRKLIKTEILTDDKGNMRFDKDGRRMVEKVWAETFKCPKCGNVVVDKKGVPVSAKMLKKLKEAGQMRCKARYMDALPDPEMLDKQGPARISKGHKDYGATDDREIGANVNIGGRKWEVKECGEALYNYTPRPYRWAPSIVIQKRLKGFFDYAVIDEVHEHKSDTSAQSMAAGKIIGACRHTLALTGTIIGGYAHHLFPLMLRLNPRTIKAEGFEWGKDMAFAEAYGRVDEIIRNKESGGESLGGNVKSMRKAKSGDRSVQRKIVPGVMPTMFGRHMIGSSMFITLESMAEELPDLFEYIGGEPGGPPVRSDFDIPNRTTAENDASFAVAIDHHARAMKGWVNTAVDMEPNQKAEYDRVVGVLEAANCDLLQRGCMKLLGAYLHTATDFPDKPFGWGHPKEVVTAHNEHFKAIFDEFGAAAAEKVKLPHTIGFWDKPGNKKLENWMGVVTPKDVECEGAFPKEQRLIDICLKQKEEGRQTWVYLNMTDKRDIQPRLKKLLEDAGLKCGVLNAKAVDPIDREEWIKGNGRKYDVMLSHPQLVATGLDLFDANAGGHNYSTLVFYETGYNLFTMRQASRRAWRIGQKQDCRVYYMYYKDTIQEKAMQLMSRKMAAAQALEGEFSEDGLAAMAGEENLQMAMAKNLAAGIDSKDIQRSWVKVKANPKNVTPAPKKEKPVETPKPISVPFPGTAGRIEWPMPRVADLAAMDPSMIETFRKLAGTPDNSLSRLSLGCVKETIERLVKLGLAERSGEGLWRCKLSGVQLAKTRTWLRLYPGGLGIYHPLGVVIAECKAQGACFVRIINPDHLPLGVEFVPMDPEHFTKTIPMAASDPRMADWTVTTCDSEDRAILSKLGLFPVKGDPIVPRKLDALDVEAQALAESLLQAKFKPINPDVAKAYEEVKPTLAKASKGKGAKISEPVPSPDEEFEVSEAMLAAALVAQDDESEDDEVYTDDFDAGLTEDVLAKMFANMMAHNAW